MGYTHYWRRELKVAPADYLGIVMDFKKLLPVFEEQGVKLADGNGEGEPEFNEVKVCFNGVEHCGHKYHELGITWPAPKAAGVAVEPAVSGSWFAGAKLEKRCCGGDCSHDPLDFPMELKPGKWQKPENGKWFEFCKTAFKPYDWAVTAFLVIAKHYLGDRLIVHSDGEIEHWHDAMQLCQIELGYGLEFKIDDEESDVK
ncbi:hypothetical protein LCGC14_0262510 [marine sediment metagenome]|uniref:Uncharacterized protein n=1 Tax=marine sediment metagenome TaxID=412755 RepID=A0A0F9UHY8_9ZZZZ